MLNSLIGKLTRNIMYFLQLLYWKYVSMSCTSFPICSALYSIRLFKKISFSSFLLKNFLFYTTTKEVVLISLWRGIRRRHWKYLMIERIKMGTFRFSFLWMRAIKVCLLSICIWKKNRIFQSILFFIFLKMYVFQFKWKLGYC